MLLMRKSFPVMHVLCFTPVPGEVRIISFRKANGREAKRHGKALPTD